MSCKPSIMKHYIYDVHFYSYKPLNIVFKYYFSCHKGDIFAPIPAKVRIIPAIRITKYRLPMNLQELTHKIPYV
uniref:OrfQ n=1 Tax=Pediococcus pentosaceus TaxID=1255 RepID=Q9X3B4_PEDPE|nr:OrfQ [Pediococcus pentosaceus]AAF22858.1 unknown [Pediococcus pentosaceus]